MESEQNYFLQNHGEKWPATMVNKQVFFTQSLARTISFPYSTADVRHINPKLSGSKQQGALSWQLQRNRFNEGWSVNYGASTIISMSISPWLGFKSRVITIDWTGWDKFMILHKQVCFIKSICVLTRMTIPVLLVHELFALVKNNSKDYNY